MTDKLLPCPFCGGEAEVFDYFNQGKQKTRWQVNCTKCMGAFGENDSKHEAIEKWNKRVNVPLYGEVEGDWHTGTPVEDGKYLVQHGKDFHEVLLVKDGKFMAVEYIETALGIKRHHYDVSETVVAWQKIEPYEASKETD